MDLQDLQDNRRSDYQFGEITEEIIGCAFQFINEMGTGFLESVYEKALAIRNSKPNDSHDTSESISEWKSSCTSCPSMFIRFVPKLMHRSLVVSRALRRKRYCYAI